jgi:hypothetical protein
VGGSLEDGDTPSPDWVEQTLLDINLSISLIDPNLRDVHLVMSPPDTTISTFEATKLKWRNVLSPFTRRDEVTLALKAMNKGRSHNGPAPEHILLSGVDVLDIYMYLSNMYFAGSQPTEVKRGILCPAYKGDSGTKSRPISVCDIAHQLADTTAAKREAKIFGDLAHPQQYGGLPNRSLNEPLLTAQLSTDHAIHYGDDVQSYFQDTSDAFDSCPLAYLNVTYMKLYCPPTISARFTQQCSKHSRTIKTAVSTGSWIDSAFLEAGSPQGGSTSTLRWNCIMNLTLCAVEAMGGDGYRTCGTDGSAHSKGYHHAAYVDDLQGHSDLKEGDMERTALLDTFRHMTSMAKGKEFTGRTKNSKVYWRLHELQIGATIASVCGITVNISKTFLMHTNPNAFPDGAPLIGLNKSGRLEYSWTKRISTEFGNVRCLGGYLSMGSQSTSDDRHDRQREQWKSVLTAVLAKAGSDCPTGVFLEAVEENLINGVMLGMRSAQATVDELAVHDDKVSKKMIQLLGIPELDSDFSRTAHTMTPIQYGGCGQPSLHCAMAKDNVVSFMAIASGHTSALKNMVMNQLAHWDLSDFARGASISPILERMTQSWAMLVTMHRGGPRQEIPTIVHDSDNIRLMTTMAMEHDNIIWRLLREDEFEIIAGKVVVRDPLQARGAPDSCTPREAVEQGSSGVLNPFISGTTSLGHMIDMAQTPHPNGAGSRQGWGVAVAESTLRTTSPRSRDVTLQGAVKAHWGRLLEAGPEKC